MLYCLGRRWHNLAVDYLGIFHCQARVAEFENATIQKQRQELQLLITELRDRDRELNEMVAAHQQQLSAWDQDRKKTLQLEEKCGQLEGGWCLLLTISAHL